MITPARGSFFTICAAASMPLSSGMAISMITTDGLSCLRQAHGLAAIGRLADDLHAGLPLDEKAQSLAHDAVVVGQIAAECRSCDDFLLFEGYPSGQNGALAGLRRRCKFAAQFPHALLHPQQAEAAHFRRVEAGAVVLHPDRQPARIAVQVTRMSLARAWRAQFVRASWTMRYTQVRWCSGRDLVRPSTCTVTGTPL